MYKYKVNLLSPNHDVLEFESKLHISMVHPKVLTEGVCMVYFNDADVALNLACIKEMEIDGQNYQLRAYNN